MQSPVEQFTIKTLIPLELFGYDISFTNASLFMILSVIISTSFLYIGIRKSHLVPDRLQNSVEILYLFIERPNGQVFLNFYQKCFEVIPA